MTASRGMGEDRYAVEYARRLYDSVMAWYQSADGKAQVILGMDSAFLAFLTAGIFSKPEDLKKLTEAFSPVTWTFLALMTLTLFGSISAAIHCLRSRIYRRSQLQKSLDDDPERIGNRDTYPPQAMWFFQMVSVLDSDKFARTLGQVDAEFEIQALASQIHILSGNVRRKHFAANVGFVLVVATLSLFFAAGISYLTKMLLR
jgi:hypothetical protein